MECTWHGCSVGGKEWEENLREVNVFWSPRMKAGSLLSSLQMALIITTTPWSEHIHSRSTNKKTKDGVCLQHPGLYTAGGESWVSTHPFTARRCWCPQYTVWFKRISSPPVSQKHISWGGERDSEQTDTFSITDTESTKHSCVTLGVQNVLLV